MESLSLQRRDKKKEEEVVKEGVGWLELVDLVAPWWPRSLIGLS